MSSLRCLQGDLGGPLGSTVTQQPCNPDLADASQLWLPLALGGDTYKFENIGTGRCLEARNGAVNGGAVDLWPCESTESNERWYWPPSQESGRREVQARQTRVSSGPEYGPDVPAAHRRAADEVYRCHGRLPIQTRVTQPRQASGFCLDVPGARTTPGLQLQTWRCNGTLAQQFWVARSPPAVSAAG